MSHSVLPVGRFNVALLLDGSFEASRDVLIHMHGSEQRQRTIDRLEAPTIKIDVNCFALRDGDDITLIDAGTGTAWGPNYGHARAAMREAGFGPEDVKRILLTHIHGDHALGLFDADAAYFPNADILVPEVDFAYFTDPKALAATPEARRGGFPIAEKLKSIYGDRVHLISPGTVLPGVEAIPLPGHTPGHTGYLIGDGSDSLLVWADALHLGALQPGDPDIGMIFDLDTALAAKTRWAILERAVSEGWTVAGSHITGFVSVERAGTGYALVPA
jgi:glyoxylase-like metal-dependent hydrolase (beta-lactamase superfamily II)